MKRNTIFCHLLLSLFFANLIKYLIKIEWYKIDIFESPSDFYKLKRQIQQNKKNQKKLELAKFSIF